MDDILGLNVRNDDGTRNDEEIREERAEYLTINRMVVGDDGIYVVSNKKFHKIISETEPRQAIVLKDEVGDEVHLVRYGRYILLCNGTETVNVYDTQAESEETRRLTCTLPEGAKIKYGIAHLENIRLVGAGEKNNVLYKSRAGKDNAPTDILDFT
jgi:hypothetical protein